MLYPYDSSALIITGPAVISQLFLPSEQIYLRMKFRSCAFSHILLSVYCSTFSSQLIPVVLAKQIIKWNTLYGWNLDSSGNIWPIYLTLFILIIKNLDEIRLKLVRFKCGNGSLFFQRQVWNSAATPLGASGSIHHVTAGYQVLLEKCQRTFTWDLPAQKPHPHLTLLFTSVIVSTACWGMVRCQRVQSGRPCRSPPTTSLTTWWPSWTSTVWAKVILHPCSIM